MFTPADFIFCSSASQLACGLRAAGEMEFAHHRQEGLAVAREVLVVDAERGAARRDGGAGLDVAGGWRRRRRAGVNLEQCVSLRLCDEREHAGRERECARLEVMCHVCPLIFFYNETGGIAPGIGCRTTCVYCLAALID
ncbi:MAG: hypothetical protein ABIT83_03420 [Massilia sp.]